MQIVAFYQKTSQALMLLQATPHRTAPYPRAPRLCASCLHKRTIRRTRPLRKRAHIPLLATPVYLSRHLQRGHHHQLPSQEQAYCGREEGRLASRSNLLALESGLPGKRTGQLCAYSGELRAPGCSGPDGLEDAVDIHSRGYGNHCGLRFLPEHRRQREPEMMQYLSYSLIRPCRRC